MGLFSGLFGGKKPEYQAAEAPKVKQATELMPAATDWAKANFGESYGARESALSDLSKGNEFYAQYQPTSFENALSNQYFQNVWPNTEAYMKNLLSQSGMAYSPTMASTLGKEYGNLSYNIGQYLSDLGNQRAQYSLSSRLAIDPYSVYSPYLNTDMSQGNLQNSFDYQAANAKADANFANAMQEYQRKNDMIDAIGGLALGAVGGGFGAMGGLGSLGVSGGLGGALQGFNLGSSLGSGNLGSFATQLGALNIPPVSSVYNTRSFGSVNPNTGMSSQLGYLPF
jgi:hypothetical protein